MSWQRRPRTPWVHRRSRARSIWLLCSMLGCSGASNSKVTPPAPATSASASAGSAPDAPTEPSPLEKAKALAQRGVFDIAAERLLVVAKDTADPQLYALAARWFEEAWAEERAVSAWTEVEKHRAASAELVEEARAALAQAEHDAVSALAPFGARGDMLVEAARFVSRRER